MQAGTRPSSCAAARARARSALGLSPVMSRKVRPNVPRLSQPVCEGDLGDGQVGVAQQRRRPLDAPREQVAVRRDAEGLLERSREVGLGDAAHARQPPTGQSSCEAASIRSFARSRRRSSSGSWLAGSALHSGVATPSRLGLRLLRRCRKRRQLVDVARVVLDDHRRLQVRRDLLEAVERGQRLGAAVLNGGTPLLS